MFYVNCIADTWRARASLCPALLAGAPSAAGRRSCWLVSLHRHGLAGLPAPPPHPVASLWSSLCTLRRGVRELDQAGVRFHGFSHLRGDQHPGHDAGWLGSFLVPIAVAVFNPMRTLSRVALQITDAIKNSIWQELSAAFGRRDWPLARRLHRSAFQLSMLLATAILIGLAFVGPRVFTLWTRGRLPFDATTFDILLLAVLANSAWNASSSVALSANRHERMSLSYLGLSVVSILIACVLLPRVGLRGAALAMFFSDLGMSMVVVRISNRLLSDPFPEFLRACFDFTQIKQLAARIVSRQFAPAGRT
jgi:hypothetical protein